MFVWETSHVIRMSSPVLWQTASHQSVGTTHYHPITSLQTELRTVTQTFLSFLSSSHLYTSHPALIKCALLDIHGKKKTKGWRTSSDCEKGLKERAGGRRERSLYWLSRLVRCFGATRPHYGTYLSTWLRTWRSTHYQPHKQEKVTEADMKTGMEHTDTCCLLMACLIIIISS